MQDWLKIEHEISVSIGENFMLKQQPNLGGGDMNQAFRIEGEAGGKAALFFIKVNRKNRITMFEAEAAGLKEIAKTGAIRVPNVICIGVTSNHCYLVLENLLMNSSGATSAMRLGQQLAALHKNTAEQFGWAHNNTIGLTEQINTPTENWITFWREQRLGFQLDLAKQKGASQSLYIKGEKLMANLESFFAGYAPEPSLLHGDLWSGNYGYLKNEDPVIFDPAVYYGDRETDIAMTELFGGFPSEFYAAYKESWPLEDGYKKRKLLYNLYHVLNHFNLFGGGYASQAENMLDQLLVNI